ncbi:MAG: 3-hydroxyisobutyrate dehydrogenase [Janthinobacterium lividum]
MTRVCFVGLGKMGAPMAGNLVKGGLDVIGYDLVSSLREAARELSVQTAEALPEALENVDIVLTMLPSGASVLAVTQQCLPLVKAGTLFIDCSTIDVETSRQIHATLAAAGMSSLDAPVSGGTAGANAATLTLMCGGDEAAFSKAEPLLQKLGRLAVYCGPAGCGQAAKICNNMVAGVIMAVTAEAFVLGDRLGLDPKKLFDVMSTSSGGSNVLTRSCPVPGIVAGSASSREYRPGFSAALMHKDLLLSQAAAASVDLRSTLGATAMRVFDDLLKSEHGALDYAAIIKIIDQ